MTIRIPGFMDEIQNYLPGINEIVSSLANPDYRRQQALRKQMLENPELQQQLTDMGSKRVEEVYGKGTGGFAGDGPKSLKKQQSDVLAAELPNILKDPVKREEWLAKQTGTQTDVERKLQNQNVESNQQVLEDKRTKSQRERDARIIGTQVVAKVGGTNNLYSAYQQKQLSPQELAAIQAIPEYKDVFDIQRDDYWKAEHLKFQREQENRLAAGQRDPLDKIFQQQDAMLSRQYAEQADRSNAQDIFVVLRDQTLRDKYGAMKEPPKDPIDLKLYEAAQAIKVAKLRQTSQDVAKAREEFRKNTQGIQAKLSNPAALRKAGLDDEQVQQLVDQYNTYSASILRPYLGDEAPVIAYSKEGAHSKRPWYQSDKATVYFVKGNDPGIEYNPANKKPNNNPVIESAAQDVIAGKVSLGELLAKAPNDSMRTELNKRVQELQNGDTLAAKKNGIVPFDTVGSEKVKSALKMPETSAINLNVGADKTDSISKAVTARELPMSKVIEYFTDGMTPKEKATATKELLAMSQNEKDQIIKQLMDSGKIR